MHIFWINSVHYKTSRNASMRCDENNCQTNKMYQTKLLLLMDQHSHAHLINMYVIHEYLIFSFRAYNSTAALPLFIVAFIYEVLIGAIETNSGHCVGGEKNYCWKYTEKLV